MPETLESHGVKPSVALRAPLIERDHEAEAIDALMDGVAEGSGAFLVVEGEAGIGKTSILTLAREMASRRRLRVLHARGREVETPFGFGIVRQLFDQVAPSGEEELFDGAARFAAPVLQASAADPSPDAPADHTFAVVHGLYWLVANLTERDGPLLIVIDDAQWCDSPSLRFLDHLVRRLSDLPVLVAVATRPAESQPELLSQLIDAPGTHLLRPTALSREAVREVIRRQVGRTPDEAFRDACATATGGNPFLVRELAAELENAGIPPTASSLDRVGDLVPRRISMAVSRRLGALQPEARALAAAVAVLGEPAIPQHAEEVARLTAEEVAHAQQVLQDARVFERGTQLRFVHPLFREAAYHNLTPSDRHGAHERALRTLRAAGVDSERLAPHLLMCEPAGDPEVVELLRDAAARALVHGAPEVSVACLRRALEEPPTEEIRKRVFVDLVHAAVQGGVFELVAQLPESVRELTENDETLMASAMDLCLMLHMTQRTSEALGLSQRAIAVARQAGDYDLVLALEGQLAMFDVWTPDLTERLIEYRPLCPPSSKGHYVWEALYGTAMYMEADSPEESAALCRAAWEGRELFPGDPLVPAFCGALEALTLAEVDSHATIEAILEAEFAEVRKHGGWLAYVTGVLFRGYLSFIRAEFDAATADAREAVEMVRAINPTRLHPFWNAQLMACLTGAGDLEAAERELCAGGLDGELPDARLMTVPMFWRAKLRVAQRRTDEALVDLFDVGRRKARSRWTNPAGTPWASNAAILLAARGETDRARELAEGELAEARRWGTPTPIGIALRACGLVEGGQRGIELLSEATELLGRTESRAEYILALIDLGSALRRAKRRAEAREPLREALALARRGGARLEAERAEAELQATGQRLQPDRRFLSGVDALTPTEHRVAALAADGLTNRDIAQSLLVTGKTVDTHMSHVFQKLEISSRREIGDRLAMSGERAA